MGESIMAPRSKLLALAIALLGASVALAQQPPAAPSAPDQSKLLPHLESWEKAMAKVETLVIDCKRTDKKVTFGSTDLFTGKAFFMKDKDDLFVLIQMEKMDKTDPTKKDKSGMYERLVCNPTAFYQYQPAEKKITFLQIPPRKPGAATDDNLLSFLFGMSAKQAMERYKLKFVKEDKDYVYVEVLPLRAEDKVDFEVARICLDRDTYLPRQLWFHQNNGDEVLWDLPTTTKNVKIDRKHFEKPELPKGWTFDEIKKEPKPSVIRPKGKD
jgi:TIGR03009 family protein